MPCVLSCYALKFTRLLLIKSWIWGRTIFSNKTVSLLQYYWTSQYFCCIHLYSPWIPSERPLPLQSSFVPSHQHPSPPEMLLIYTNSTRHFFIQLPVALEILFGFSCLRSKVIQIYWALWVPLFLRVCHEATIWKAHCWKPTSDVQDLSHKLYNGELTTITKIPSILAALKFKLFWKAIKQQLSSTLRNATNFSGTG